MSETRNCTECGRGLIHMPNCSKRVGGPSERAVHELMNGDRVTTAGRIVPPCLVWPSGRLSEWCLRPLNVVCPEHH